MSRTYKDKPSRLVGTEREEDESLIDFFKTHKLSKAEQVYIRKFLYKKPNHGRLMRTFAGAYCTNRNCCTKKPSGGERQKEKAQWRKEVRYV